MKPTQKSTNLGSTIAMGVAVALTSVSIITIMSAF